jgi:LytTr DNA-binding domain
MDWEFKVRWQFVGLVGGLLEPGRIVDVVNGDNVHDRSLHPFGHENQCDLDDENTSATIGGNRQTCRIAFLLVHFPDGKLLIRRSLGAFERRLDSSIFFRASRDCIVNLSHVKRPRLPEERSCCLADKAFASVKHAVSSSGIAGHWQFQTCKIWWKALALPMLFIPI